MEIDENFKKEIAELTTKHLELILHVKLSAWLQDNIKNYITVSPYSTNADVDVASLVEDFINSLKN